MPRINNSILKMMIIVIIIGTFHRIHQSIHDGPKILRSELHEYTTLFHTIHKINFNIILNLILHTLSGIPIKILKT
jgi:hypothetical protein